MMFALLVAWDGSKLRGMVATMAWDGLIIVAWDGLNRTDKQLTTNRQAIAEPISNKQPISNQQAVV